MHFPDVYYLPQWSILNEKQDEGKAEVYNFQCEFGHVYYPFIKRRISTRINNEVYFDIITPYGFNGPVIISSNNKEELLREFDNHFRNYCLEHKIISEFVRFSPWLKNHLDFENYYQLKLNNQTLFVDLKKDFFSEEFSSKCRNVIRKAQKNNINVELDFEGKYIEEFYNLYIQMAKKNQISSYYLFDLSYIIETFEKMKGHIFIANAIYNGESKSAAMFLFDRTHIHYHLSGNNYEYTSLGANSLILNNVSMWAQEQDLSKLHLGGAFDEGLFKFKASFTKKGFLNYFIGTNIRDKVNYKKLVEINGVNPNGYFPEYRV